MSIVLRVSPANNSLPTVEICASHALRLHEVNGRLVVMAKYEGIKTFDGVKVLVYATTNIKQYLSQDKHDPHFVEGGDNLIARFVPNESGWRQALRFARAA